MPAVTPGAYGDQDCYGLPRSVEGGVPASGAEAAEVGFRQCVGQVLEWPAVVDEDSAYAPGRGVHCDAEVAARRGSKLVAASQGARLPLEECEDPLECDAKALDVHQGRRQSAPAGRSSTSPSRGVSDRGPNG